MSAGGDAAGTAADHLVNIKARFSPSIRRRKSFCLNGRTSPEAYIIPILGHKALLSVAAEHTRLADDHVLNAANGVLESLVAGLSSSQT